MVHEQLGRGDFFSSSQFGFRARRSTEVALALGYDSVAVAWFRSYLSGRRQAVEVGNVGSEWTELDIGTLQGSILEPFMFVVYMNFI